MPLQSKITYIMEQESIILEKLNEVQKSLILATKKLLTVKEAAVVSGLSVQYLHRLTSQRRITHYKPNGKTIFIDRNDLEKWLRQRRIVGEDEATAEAVLSDYINSGK